MINIVSILANITSPTFASFLYRSKTDNSLARYTVILGAKYTNLLDKSKLALEIEMQTMDSALLPAAQAVMDSLNKSIEAHSKGEQNSDYTKKDQYIPLGNGININSNDASIQVFGLIHSKVVILAGDEKKPVKSSPMTIAKNTVRRMLPISKFREFAFDIGNIHAVKVSGDTLVIVDSSEVSSVNVYPTLDVVTV